MKIIDDKGKLFGIVNLLDLFVAIFILVIVIAVSMKLVNNPESYAVSSEDNVKDMYVTLRCQSVTDSFIDSLAPGDKLLAQNAYTGGEVFEVGAPTPAEYTGVDDNGNVVVSEHPYLKDVYVTVVTKQNIETPVLKVNGQESRVGTKIFFKTQKVETPAMVMSIEFKDVTN